MLDTKPVRTYFTELPFFGSDDLIFKSQVYPFPLLFGYTSISNKINPACVEPHFFLRIPIVGLRLDN